MLKLIAPSFGILIPTEKLAKSTLSGSPESKEEDPTFTELKAGTARSNS